MKSDATQEQHTPAIVMYRQAMEFLESAKRLDSNDTPALFLACHGLELALKAYLRAKGARLSQLRAIRHSIIAALNDCVAQGLASPPQVVADILTIVEWPHASYAYRYWSTYRQVIIDRRLLLRAGAWASCAVLPAVAQSAGLDPESVGYRKMQRAAKALEQP